MKDKLSGVLALLVALLAMTACEKMVIDEEPAGDDEVNVVLKVAGLESYGDGTRAKANVADVCSRIQFALYQNGKRIKYLNQQKTDEEGFGTAKLSLSEGTYQLLILAHSGKNNVTTTKADELKFTNPEVQDGIGFTDTFYYYGQLTVEAEKQSYDFQLTRAVAMFRFISEDAKPATIKTIRFYYTGGSGTLDATKGEGCVKSTQIVWFYPDEAADGKPVEYELYTFPLNGESSKVTFQVSAYNTKNEVVYEREFKDVEMTRNTITQYTGKFFTTGGTDPDPTPTPTADDRTFTMTVETDWGATKQFTF